MPFATTMIDAAVRVRLGLGLADLYEANAAAMPLLLTEQLARLAFAEDMAEADCSRQLHGKPATAPP